MPWADTHAMAEHLKLISAEVAPGAHAILIVDQAGWHTSPKLDVPESITLLPLPPRSPELNPVEISGNSCATTGSQIGSSETMTTSSRCVVRHGTNSSINQTRSHPSDRENGPIGSDQ